MFTSGTAGLPRAAVLTHRNLLANVAQVQAHPGRLVSASDVTLAALPLFHVFGLTVTLCVPLAAGGSIVLVPRFDPSGALELCERHRVAILAGAPAMFAALAAAPAGDRGTRWPASGWPSAARLPCPTRWPPTSAPASASRSTRATG